MNAYKSHIVRLLLMALLVLPAMTSCYDYGSEVVVSQDAGSVSYIKLNISVRTSNTVTRALQPLGGENGDGLEAGYVRENQVDGVTLILYRADAGINAAGDTPIDFVRYFETSLVENSRVDQGTTNNTRFDEAVYTTGERLLNKEDAILINAKYHAIVVANTNLMGVFHKGSTLAEVRDFLVDGSMLYSGSGKMTDANKFIMASEADYVIDFPGTTPTTPTNKTEGKLYSFNNIHIERLAARVDFWADGSEGYQTKDKNDFVYPHPGYRYKVGNTADRFVLVNVVPFNVSRGSEYLIKRTTHETTPYLDAEDETNWVVDAYINNSNTPKSVPTYWDYMESRLSSIDTSTDFSLLPYNVSMASRQAAGNHYSIKGADNNNYDNMIICYPSENTLNTTSLLYYNATGLAFEGYYYPGDDANQGIRCVYYHYLRHQGENDAANSYQALKKDELDKETTCGTTKAMNYGIVRNNIYRVSIESINPLDGTIKIKIEEEKWRHVDNPVIYI